MAEHAAGTLDRRAVMSAILQARGEALVITGLGTTTYDAGQHDHPGIFYLWGAMGAAAMMGLGLAQAQPGRRVVVVTGDGEMLMGFGALATIGASAPPNLAIVVIDNELYSETGMQPTHTSKGVDLAGAAQSCNFAVARTVRNDNELKHAIPDLFTVSGPSMLVVKVSARRYPMTLRLRDGAHIKNRFREHVLGAAAFD